MHLESSLDIHVPEAERLVNPWRQRYHECAAFGVPAHISLLYPFIPPADITPAILEDLRLFFSTIPSFRFTLDHLGHFPDAHILYLAPEPIESLSALIKLLAHRYPETLPYGGLFEEVTPHVTIARSADPRVIQQITETFQDMEPIEIQVTEACLMAQQHNQHWQTHAHFPLAQGNIRPV